MFNLLEKMFEVVVPPPILHPEKCMRSRYKTKINTKLTKSTWPGEQDCLKFWLLTNGDVIPVEYSHDDTAVDVGVRYSPLMDDGAFAGSIVGSELSLSGKQKFTAKQILRLKNIFIEYRIAYLVVSAKDCFSVGVKSSKELAYYLEYGKEEWESKIESDLLEEILEVTATKVNPEKQMQDYYEKIVNTKMEKSRHTGWSRCWLLSNGNTVPVNYLHDNTAHAAGVDYLELMRDGAFSVGIFRTEMTLTGERKFTSKQISKLKNIYIEYKIKTLSVSIGDQSYNVDVKSSKELAYYIEYGKESWESKNKADLIEQLLNSATSTDMGRKREEDPNA